jgi:asparagine synthetase B (glutamine-hydrolysing)
MPGLVGIVPKQQNIPVHGSLFKAMVAGLCHRSWYHVDTYHTPKLAVARVHLNIFNTARQPHVSENGRVKIFLHGEIYGDELGKSDQLKTIAQAYERHGRDFAKELNGSFVVLIVDHMMDKVLIATDRTASRPLFYFQDDAYLYFAPEPKALALVPSLTKRINVAAMASFLACGHYLNGQALLEDVHPLDNAAVLTVNPESITTHKYWQYTFNESAEDRGEAYYRGALGELIRQAVRRRTRGEHRYAIPLSGGYDSRGILGCCLDEHPQDRMITISWGVEEDLPNSDCAVAKRLADRLGLTHAFFPLRVAHLPPYLSEFVSLHDGLTDACDNYPESLKIFSDIRTELGVQVILRGDESFGFSRPACDERTIFDKLSILPLDQSRHYRKVLREPWLTILSDSIRQALHEITSRCNTTDIYLRQNFVYFDQRIKHCLNPLNYIKSLELEVRTPYLDNDILDFMRELPSHYHFGKRFYRAMMRQMFPDVLSEMALRSNLPDLDVMLRTTAMKELICRINLGPSSPLDEYFDWSGLRALHDKYLTATNQTGAGRHFIKKTGRVLARWPTIHRLGYKIYLPIQDKRGHDFITEGRILLRLLTMNLYLQGVLRVASQHESTPDKDRIQCG